MKWCIIKNNSCNVFKIADSILRYLIQIKVALMKYDSFYQTKLLLDKKHQILEVYFKIIKRNVCYEPGYLK